VGLPGSGKTLLIIALVEELRRRGHRVGSAEAHGGASGGARERAMVIALPSGARVTTAAALGADGLRRLARRLDPQLALLLLEEAGAEAVPATGGPDEPAAAPAGTPTIELLPPGGAPRTPPDELLAAVSAERIAAIFALVGPGDTLGLAALVERALLGAAAGGSLDVAAEPPPAATQRGAEGRRGVLMRSLGSARRAARGWMRRGLRGGDGGR
jgi:hypothetical protein